MSSLVRWWNRRSGAEKVALAIGGGIVVVATGGAIAYAIATEGLIIVSGGTLIAVGKVATRVC